MCSISEENIVSLIKYYLNLQNSRVEFEPVLPMWRMQFVFNRCRSCQTIFSYCTLVKQHQVLLWHSVHHFPWSAMLHSAIKWGLKKKKIKITNSDLLFYYLVIFARLTLMNLPTIWEVYFGSCWTLPSSIKETRIYFLYDSNIIWLTAMAGVVIAWARKKEME